MVAFLLLLIVCLWYVAVVLSCPSLLFLFSFLDFFFFNLGVVEETI